MSETTGQIHLSEPQLAELRKFLNLELTYSSKSLASILLKGREGSGKTSFLATAPGPILIDHFDVSGTQSIHDSIYPNGNILVRRWYNRASAYQSWVKQWNADLRSNFLDIFNTYCIDSGTALVEAMATQCINENSKSPRSGLGAKIMNIGDYQGMYATLMQHIALTEEAIPIFIMTFHTSIVQDDLTSEITYELSCPGQLKDQLPRQFAEKWVVLAKPNNKRVLITGRFGRERASTQIGKDSFKLEEELNLTKLLAKAKIPVLKRQSLKEILK